MMRPAKATLHQRPEPFDGVRVHVAHDVDASRVVNTAMLVSALVRDADVGGRLVGIDDGLRKHPAVTCPPRVAS